MNCAAIATNLFVGPCPCDEDDLRYLKSRSVTAILSLLTPEDQQELGATQAEIEARTAGLVYRNVPVNDFDDLDLKRRLPACVEALHDLLKTVHHVYVHCTAGVTRSPIVIAAYLHWQLHWPLDHAIERLQALRRCYPRADLI
jgi:protein-tyrosine phosphatase